MSSDEQSHSSPWKIYPLAIIGLIYLLNPGSGVIELIPDNIPIIGNLDEAAAAFLVWQGFVMFTKRRKKKNENNADKQITSQTDKL